MTKRHDPDFERLCEDAKSRIREVSVDDVRALQDAGSELLLVDVREDREWDAGHVVGAEHLGRGVLERDVAEHVDDKDRPIVLYCGGGYRSALAADNLQRMGYRDVASMAGGIRAWREAGYPTTDA